MTVAQLLVERLASWPEGLFKSDNLHESSQALLLPNKSGACRNDTFHRKVPAPVRRQS
jgi:hypothetical protein